MYGTCPCNVRLLNEFFFSDKSGNIFFLGVFLDVDFSNDVPPPSVCIVVQAAGSIRPPKEYVFKRKR